MSVRSLLPSGLPRSHLTAPGVPVRSTVLDFASHVTESHRRPEVACVTSTEIPAVVNVISPAVPGSESSQGFSSCFPGALRPLKPFRAEVGRPGCGKAGPNHQARSAWGLAAEPREGGTLDGWNCGPADRRE
ncbi:uncharacterized protein LOC144617128 [Panthera onca]